MGKNFFSQYKLIVLILFFFISCKEVFIKGNFVATAPEGWIRKDTVSKDGCKKVQFFKRTEDTSLIWRENIAITVVHSKYLSDYVNSVLSLTKKDAIFFEEKGRADTTIKGYKAIWVQINVLYNKATDDEKKDQKIYFLKEGVRNIYMVICTAHKGGIGALQNSIDNVLNSFKIINEGPATK
jgi:hypothetical protein